MDVDRSDLALLSAVAAQGSLAGAARALELAPTVVSKRLAALESRLDTRLLHRTTRRLRFTAEGEAFVTRARELLAGFEALEQELAERQHEPRGRLRVLSSFGFGRQWVAPALAAFKRRHPAIELQLHLADELPDLQAGRFDAAIWLWQPRAGNLLTRKLADNRRIVVAAPDYLARHGTPQVPADLSAHDCLLVREHDDRPTLWRLQELGRRTPPLAVPVRGGLSSNHGEVVRDWALQGFGLMLRSLWDVHAHLRSGALVHVLPGWAMLDADVHWLAPPRDPRLPAPRRVRLLQEHLAAAFAAPPWAPELPARRRR